MNPQSNVHNNYKFNKHFQIRLELLPCVQRNSESVSSLKNDISLKFIF